MHSLTSALDESELSVLCPGRFTPTEKVPDTHWLTNKFHGAESFLGN
jgi:hypothetical protein